MNILSLTKRSIKKIMAPRTIKQFEEIRENKKALIMRCALELFASNGYHSSSIKEIANKAKISKGLLYNYFESKEDLLKEIIIQGLETMNNLIDPDHDGVITTGEMRFMINEMFHILTDHRIFLMLYFSILTQPDVMILAGKEIEKFFEQMIRMLEAYFRVRGSTDPRADAYLFGAILDGAFFNYILNNRDYPIEQVKKRIVELFIK
jgi:AcrR family transcriptional regulator